jgi:hypothetical protein
MSTTVAAESLQTIFLNQIRHSLPKNVSLADELAEVLAVSRDSAYRRIRGETVLSLEEVARICARYKISVDRLLSQPSDVLTFTRQCDVGNSPLIDWLNNLVASLKMIEAYPEKEIIYSAKDIPPPYYFKFPELALFKMFFWMKSYQLDPRLDEMKYRPELIPTSYLDAGCKLWLKYSEVPSTEIWNDETFNVTIRQIEFYLANGFITLAEAASLFEIYIQMINDIRTSAAAGRKREGNGAFKLYSNEFLISDTTFFFDLGDRHMAFITYNTMNVLSSVQESFCRETREFLHNIIKKSSLISTTGERERNRFFNAAEARIRHRLNILH